ncbi:MAG: ABC transporter permease [Chloroflexi bacterium]|nr:ABC transporter permease [Chloroflexota bacterium]MCL5076133.1 ABC transporter permease [Chloroflexota bacterium]
MDWSKLLTEAFLIGLSASTIRLATPVLVVVLGEIFAELSGVLNLGLEGMMLMGAIGGFVTTYITGNPWLGLLIGTLAGGLMGLLMAFLTVTLRVDQVISGIALVILGQGVSGFVFRRIFGAFKVPPGIQGFEVIHVPILDRIPILGPVLLEHTILVYLVFALVPLTWIALNRTTIGLKLRAVGEHPRAADTVGINVYLVRYSAVIFGGVMAGLGGAILTVGQLHFFVENVTAGRGWIAIALVIFAKWDPFRALGGALLFGFADALQMRLQALGFAILPYEFLIMVPYLLTILVLLGAVGRTVPPAALTVPYEKEQG